MVSKYNKQAYERQYDHPMIKLMDKPNPYYDGLLLLAATIADWMMSGNAYWVKLRANMGNPVELWWVPSALIEPKWENQHYLDYYNYMPGYGTVRLASEDVIHFRDGIDPDNTRKGLSPLASLFREVFTDHEAANMTASLLRNLGIPGLIIAPKTEATVPPAEAEKLKEKFRQNFTGDKRGEPLVLGFPSEVNVLGYNPQQMDLKALRRIPEERISAVLGVPAIVAGLGAGLDRATYSNYAEARESAYESTIIPTQRLFNSVLKRQLLSEYESDIDNWLVSNDLSEVRILQEDKDRMATRLNTMVSGGWMAVDDAQRMAGAPVDDSQHIYLRSPLLMEVPARTSKALPGVETKASEEYKDAEWKRVDSRRVAYWQPVTEKILKLYMAEGRAIAKAVRATGNPLDNAEQALEAGREGWEKNLYAIDLEVMRDFAREFQPAKALKQTLDEFELFVTEWLKAHATKSITSILATNLEDVKSIIVAGVQEGQSHYTMANQLKQFYEDRSYWKAERVSRTEVGTATGKAQQVSAEQSGVVKTKSWLSARDGRVRDSHSFIDGETVTLDQHFSNGLDYPGDPGGTAEEIINCRCVAIYNVD